MNSAVECVILVGLQGSGKTTFYQRWFQTTHRHISKDHWPNAKRKEVRQQQALAEMLGRGESVVVDNTNPTVAERARIIEVARAHGARVIGYYFETSTRAAVARNAARAGRAKVPNVAIFSTAKRLQPPVASEGFDQLFRVVLEGETQRVIEIVAENPAGHV